MQIEKKFEKFWKNQAKIVKSAPVLWNTLCIKGLILLCRRESLRCVKGASNETLPIDAATSVTRCSCSLQAPSSGKICLIRESGGISKNNC
jgi:hypothetical protein